MGDTNSYSVMLIYVSFILLTPAVYATEFEDCGSLGENVEVVFPGCEIPPCIVPRGADLDGNITFTAASDSATYKNEVYAVVGGIPLPWPGFDPDFCGKLSEGDCPGEKREKLTYNIHTHVEDTYPKISLVINWNILDESGRTAVCFNLPAEVV